MLTFYPLCRRGKETQVLIPATNSSQLGDWFRVRQKMGYISVSRYE